MWGTPRPLDSASLPTANLLVRTDIKVMSFIRFAYGFTTESQTFNPSVIEFSKVGFLME